MNQIKKTFFKKMIYRVVRIFLGGVFIISGSLKSADLVSFSETIGAFAILPEELNMAAAVGICLCELVFGTGLVLDIRGSLLPILVLLLIFVAVLGYAIHMGYDIDCGCFGPEDPESKAFSSLRTSIARNLVMIGVVIYLYTWRHVAGHIPVSLKTIVKEKRLK
ncbi:MAG: DoxX family protein [Desulfobacterales bacterium]|nr:DoxX family protein [Desulfobacterales bacterium]